MAKDDLFSGLLTMQKRTLDGTDNEWTKVEKSLNSDRLTKESVLAWTGEYKLKEKEAMKITLKHELGKGTRVFYENITEWNFFMLKVLFYTVVIRALRDLQPSRKKGKDVKHTFSHNTQCRRAVPRNKLKLSNLSLWTRMAR